MPALSVSDDTLLDRLSTLFRRTGFDGASLSEISVATGLKRSSLYHRFPGGKSQMALDATLATSDDFADRAAAALAGDRRPADRARAFAAMLDEFYDGGRRGCLLETLSLGAVPTEAAVGLTAAAAAWVDALASIARDAGLATDDARHAAEDVVASVEGALVLARITGDVGAFRRVLDRLPDTLSPPTSAQNLQTVH